MYNDQMPRALLQARWAVGLGVVLLGANLISADEGRWYTGNQVKRGAAVFAQNCAECHGANADATPNWRETTPDGKYPPPPLNGTAHAWHHSLAARQGSAKHEAGSPRQA
jgi:mono/diheme cytochrome c family protein